MYDPRRLVAPAAAVALVTGLMAAEAFLLSAASGARLQRVPKYDTFMDASVYNDVGGRVAGAVRPEPVAASRGTPVGVLLGSSVLHWSIDPEVLDRECGGKIRWLSLYGNDVNIEDMADFFDLAFRNGIKPDVVVLAYTPFLLARAPEPTLGEALGRVMPVLRGVASGRLDEIRQGIRTLDPLARDLIKRALPSRTSFNNAARRNLLEARAKLFEAMGLGADACFAPARDPWRVPHPRAGLLAMANPDDTNVMLGKYRQRGWFDSGNFAGGGAYGPSLVNLIRRTRALGARFVIVSMPQSTAVRSQMPPEAGRCLGQLLESSFGKDDAPLVIDYSAMMPDDAFYDPAHLNYRASGEFSRVLGKDLDSYLHGGRTIAGPTSSTRDRAANAAMDR